jgi:RHS repeat-associated protein
MKNRNNKGSPTHILRHGRTGSTGYGVIDNLTLAYDGNRLCGVEDMATSPTLSTYDSGDFRNNDVTADMEYTYDANGNRTADLNMGVSEILHNILNLPRRITANGAMKYFVYSAAGDKLRTVTEISTVDYVGNLVYEDGNLRRILVDGGYIEGGEYHFYLTDHLGNNRVVAHSGGAIHQINHYYPYGMAFAEGTQISDQPYKYGGKEKEGWQNLGSSDFLARMYQAALMEFDSQDPMQEKFYAMSPYAYCGGNPMNRVDPDGRSFFFASWVIGFFDGISRNGNPLKGFEYAAKRAWNQVEISGGLFVGNPLQVISRWRWELPQTIAGFTWSSIRNVTEEIDHVKYFDGATFVINEYKDRPSVSLGSYININDDGEMPVDDDGNFAPYKVHLYMHEYGHYLQSQAYGWGYLVSVGLPSAISIKKSKLITDKPNPNFFETHDIQWFERRANKKAEEYFRKNYKVSWNTNIYPIDYPF